MSKNFRSAANIVVAKQRLRNPFSGFFANYAALDNVMKFSRRYYLFVSEDLSQYEKREIKTSRIIKASLVRLFPLISCVRYFLSALINTEGSTVILADANHLITNQRLLSTVIGLGALILVYIEALIQVNEVQYKLFVFDFLIDWKAKRVLPLNVKNSQRLTLIINLMTKLLMKQAFWPLVVVTSAVLLSMTVKAYLDPTSGFPLITTLFFSLCLFNFVVQMFCLLCAGCVLWTVPNLYFKYKFREINEQIGIILYLF